MAKEDQSGHPGGSVARGGPPREQTFGNENGLLGIEVDLFAREPSPVEAVALAEELEQLMRPLDALHRRMLELRLQAYTLEEIASQTGRTQRTVRRVLDSIKEQLAQARHSGS